jgi:hypothetical protein
VATFGYFGFVTVEVVGVPYVLLADVALRLAALNSNAIRLTASRDTGIRLTTTIADMEL